MNNFVRLIFSSITLAPVCVVRFAYEQMIWCEHHLFTRNKVIRQPNHLIETILTQTRKKKHSDTFKAAKKHSTKYLISKL